MGKGILSGLYLQESLPLSLPGPESQSPRGQGKGMGLPCQLLSCFQAGHDGQWLAGEGHNAMASSCVALQHLSKVGGHCQGEDEEVGAGTEPRCPPRSVQTLGLPLLPVSGLQRPATSSGEPLT